MQVQWYGQSAFRLTDGDQTVFIDPFADVSVAASRGLQFDYPAIQGVEADLLLVTHEHFDHNGVDAIGGDPVVIRSTAGKKESPIGEVLAVASEHDAKAGTERGPNTIFVFSFGGMRVAHFGDFGQTELRPEQAEAIGSVDLLFIPVGAGPTIGPEQAHAIAQRLGARWVVPMHYRTERVNFLDPPDAYLDLIGSVQRFDSTTFETSELHPDGSHAVVTAVP
jgi:L-ascorbate metabolism protein UlaG (beta-lactamase superfamily)